MGSRPMKGFTAHEELTTLRCVHGPKKGRTLEDLDDWRVFEGPKWYTKEMQKEKEMMRVKMVFLIYDA